MSQLEKITEKPEIDSEVEPEIEPEIELLSKRELGILDLISQGLSNRDISERHYRCEYC